MRVRLTDQALVALALAREQAEAGGAEASAADLLVGLAVEPEGAAGHLLRDRSTAVARLAELDRPATTAADEVVAEAAAASRPRPVATLDLLYAAMDVGGEALLELLSDAGWEPSDLRAMPPGPAGETLGSLGEARLVPAAAAAVARARAAGGNCVGLLYELAEGPAGDALALGLPPVPPEPAPDDAGIDAVLDAARRFRRDGPVTPADLVRATLVVGGETPRRLLGDSGGDSDEA